MAAASAVSATAAREQALSQLKTRAKSNCLPATCSHFQTCQTRNDQQHKLKRVKGAAFLALCQAAGGPFEQRFKLCDFLVQVLHVALELIRLSVGIAIPTYRTQALTTTTSYTATTTSHPATTTSRARTPAGNQHLLSQS